MGKEQWRLSGRQAGSAAHLGHVGVESETGIVHQDCQGRGEISPGFRKEGSTR